MPLHWPAARHIYLSPHLDDAALSCGGMIAIQARTERVAVITLCAGSPPDPLPDSPLIRDLHARWRQSALAGAQWADAPAMRRAEDARACRALGALAEPLHLDFLDCIYRVHPATGEPLYPHEESLFGEVDPDDPLLAALGEADPLPDGAMLYVPLAVGGHVDHRAVRRAADGWHIPPGRMVYYEDYPYAGKDGAIEAVTGGEGWGSRATPLDDQALAAKVEAVAAYESQISTFWPDRAAMEVAIRGFAALRSGERLWLRSARSARR